MNVGLAILAAALGLAIVAQGLLRRRRRRVACGLLYVLGAYLAWCDSGLFPLLLVAAVLVPDSKGALPVPLQPPRVQPRTDLEEIFS